MGVVVDLVDQKVQVVTADLVVVVDVPKPVEMEIHHQ